MLLAGTLLRRGHRTSHPDPTQLVPGVGQTRFAPYPDVAHVYVAQTAFAALLESALHDTAGPGPQLPMVVLDRWAEAEVELAADVRLIDLRDRELDRLGLAREQLVSTAAGHYPCTRAWAEPLQGRRIGGHVTHGLIWNSRQAELHVASVADRPALADLVDHHPTDVAVLWSPPAGPHLLRPGQGGLGPLAAGPGHGYVRDLANLLGIPIE